MFELSTRSYMLALKGVKIKKMIILEPVRLIANTANIIKVFNIIVRFQLRRPNLYAYASLHELQKLKLDIDAYRKIIIGD